jgi:hypothetical protein
LIYHDIAGLLVIKTALSGLIISFGTSLAVF